MLKKSTIPVSLMLVSLVVFSVVTIKTALAAGYVSVTNGYQILVNQGIASFTAQTRNISIDTSKVTTSFFIPTKTIGEVDSYIASPLHTAVQQGGDTTPPVFTLESTSQTWRAYRYVQFHINENGYYKIAYSTSGYPSEPGSAWIPMSANSAYSSQVGGAYNTFYYYRVFYKDTVGNSGAYSGTLTTPVDTDPPAIGILSGPSPSVTNPPSYELGFNVGESGYYGFDYAIDTYPNPTMSTPSVAWQNYLVLIGDQADVGYYYTIKARDSLGNTSTHQNYVVTTSDSDPPVISNIQEKPVEFPVTDISFDSDEAGEFLILYAATEEGLMEFGDPGQLEWVSMTSGHNAYPVGDERVNTDFYYIIYVRDALLNTTDSGVLTVGKPGGDDDGNPDISIVNQYPSPEEAPAVEIYIQNDTDSDSFYYQLFWSEDREYINGLKNIEPSKFGISLDVPRTVVRDLIGDQEFTHYYYRIYTEDAMNRGVVNSTDILELDTESGR